MFQRKITDCNQNANTQVTTHMVFNFFNALPWICEFAKSEENYQETISCMHAS